LAIPVKALLNNQRPPVVFGLHRPFVHQVLQCVHALVEAARNWFRNAFVWGRSERGSAAAW